MYRFSWNLCFSTIIKEQIYKTYDLQKLIRVSKFLHELKNFTNGCLSNRCGYFWCAYHNNCMTWNDFVLHLLSHTFLNILYIFHFAHNNGTHSRLLYVQAQHCISLQYLQSGGKAHVIIKPGSSSFLLIFSHFINSIYEFSEDPY